MQGRTYVVAATDLSRECQKVRENPLGHSPHHEFSVMERPARKLEAAGSYYSIAPPGIVHQARERHPKAVGDFVAQDRLRVMADERDKRTHDHGRQPNYSRTKVIELTNNHTVPTDVDSGFFPCLPNRCIHQRLVAGLFTAAGECNLTTP